MPRIMTVAIKHGRDTMAKNSDARICTGEQGMIVKKLCFVILLLSLPLLAKEYYAKVEPYEIRTVASNVSGIVVSADETLEGKRLGTAPFLRIDDEIDRVDLEKTRTKIVLLRRAVTHDKAMAENYERIIAKKTENYEKVAALKMRSQVEKDREFYDLLGTENQLMTIRKEMENLEVQINDLQLHERRLERSISDKSPAAPGLMLYELMVKEGEVVAPGTPLARLADVSRARLTLYLTGEDREGVETRRVYIDGQPTEYVIDRLWNVADSKQLSSYRAEIVIAAPKRFSQLVKVEFRDE